MRMRLAGLLSLLFVSVSVEAKTFTIPEKNNNIIGDVQYISASSGDSLVNIAQRYDIGFDQISDANPNVNPVSALPSGTRVKVPGSFLLPPIQRKGIIINLAEMRMYYFPQGSDQVYSYPIGIGKIGKTIPLINTAVLRKVKDPVWIPPDDIRAFNEEQGIVLPTVMPAGPDNPLGPYAIYLRLPTFLIHSTIYPESIGRRASFGCIRMLERDIKDFYPIIKPGTPVAIINMPSKAGWVDDKLFLESHAPLEEHASEYQSTYKGMLDTVQNAAKSKGHLVLVDWQMVADVSEIRDGVPHEVGFVVR